MSASGHSLHVRLRDTAGQARSDPKADLIPVP